MPDAESFIAAIAATPADDLPRLVFADWLDENGDSTRAAFIRDHVALAKLRPGTDEYKTLFRKCADALRANLPAWIQPACDAFGQPAEWKPVRGNSPREMGMLLHPRYPLTRLDFVRGLIDHVELSYGTVNDSAPVEQLFQQHPISRLSIEMPGRDHDPGKLFPAHPLPVEWLTIYGVIFLAHLETLLAADAFSRVKHLDIQSASVAEHLTRSPMAKRLTSLSVYASRQALEALHDYPLDDRLQFVKVRPLDEMPSDLWSALSRVAFRPTLKRLDLTRCGMTGDGLAAFARGEEWVRLQGLKLGGNLFGDRGWADFCRGWRTPELTYLDASRNRLTDAGAEMLARSGMVRSLRVIDLRGNRIAGRGAVALARRCAEAKVTKLLLAGNPVGKREAASVRGLLGERCDIG